MEENNILSLMVDQHGLIEALFFIFKDEAKEKTERVKNSFSEFSWELRKHFFVEEGVIFDYLPWRDPFISETIERLKDEHIEMLNQLSKMAEDLLKVEDEQIESFYNLLKSHREMEEINLYPALDKRLTVAQKEQVIKKIDEIPFKK